MPGNAETQRRRIEALDLRLAGASYRQIALSMGIGVHAVWNHVQAAMRETMQEAADVVRAQEIQRLDRMMVGVYPRAVGGDIGAITVVLKLMDRRAAYLGLDTPVLHTVQLTIEDRARALVADGLALTMEDARMAVVSAEAQVRGHTGG